MTFYPILIETKRCGAALRTYDFPLAPYVVNPSPRLVLLQPLHSLYTAEQIDTLVAYIVAEDARYVIPVEAPAPRAHLLFYPTGSNCGGRYEKYREAWDLMKTERENQDFDHSSALAHLLPR